MRKPIDVLSANEPLSCLMFRLDRAYMQGVCESVLMKVILSSLAIMPTPNVWAAKRVMIVVRLHVVHFTASHHRTKASGNMSKTGRYGRTVNDSANKNQPLHPISRRKHPLIVAIPTIRSCIRFKLT